MEFLKALFGTEPLTYEAFAAKVTEANMNLVNLAAGGYVSQAKHDDKVKGLNGQVKDLQEQIAQRDTDLNTLRGQLTAAQADVGKLADTQKSLDDMRAKYDTDKQAYEQRLAQQGYEFAVREKANELKFTSTAAKKAFVQEAINKGFKLDGDKLDGYDAFLAQYQSDDPGAFVAKDPEPTPPTPKIVLPNGGDPKTDNKHVSLTDMMRMRNENPDLEIDFGN